MLSHGTNFVKICRKKVLIDWRKPLVHATFGIYMVGLTVLLILLYAGVPIVGS